ncbi:MAG TPA: hypothetical protein VLQ45_17830, partial [Thermoanaerobaculia bacterium]|nr:hypothetical protein [Thermoanaerobaculia bacterium]
AEGRKPGAESPGPGYNRRMEPIHDPEILARARATFDLFEFSDQVMRQNLRRKYPQASEEEIRERFVAWAEKRPYVGLSPSSKA